MLCQVARVYCHKVLALKHAPMVITISDKLCFGPLLKQMKQWHADPCCAVMKAWMQKNKLKMNAEKTGSTTVFLLQNQAKMNSADFLW